MAAHGGECKCTLSPSSMAEDPGHGSAVRVVRVPVPTGPIPPVLLLPLAFSSSFQKLPDRGGCLMQGHWRLGAWEEVAGVPRPPLLLVRLQTILSVGPQPPPLPVGGGHPAAVRSRGVQPLGRAIRRWDCCRPVGLVRGRWSASTRLPDPRERHGRFPDTALHGTSNATLGIELWWVPLPPCPASSVSLFASPVIQRRSTPGAGALNRARSPSWAAAGRSGLVVEALRGRRPSCWKSCAGDVVAWICLSWGRLESP